MNKEFLKPLVLLLAVYAVAVSLFKCEAEKQEGEEEGTQKETIEVTIEENLKEKICNHLSDQYFKFEFIPPQ